MSTFVWFNLKLLISLTYIDSSLQCAMYSARRGIFAYKQSGAERMEFSIYKL